MEQLLVHLWADYYFQSSWMALEKHKKTLNCLVHVVLYTLCFVVLTTSWKALLVIGGTHFLLDRFQLTKYLIYAKEQVLRPASADQLWKYCDSTGYYDDEGAPDTERIRPKWITVWLYIITDNLFHLTINYFALLYL